MSTDDIYRADEDVIQLRITDDCGQTVDWRPIARAETSGLAFTLAASANVGYRRMAEVYADAMIDHLREDGPPR